MIVVDVETTGICPEKNSIVSIGALEFENPRNQFYIETRIFDGAEISDEALRINGFSRASLSDEKKALLKEGLLSFILWSAGISDKTLCGENVTFDLNFLNESAKRYGLPVFGRRVVDLHSLSYESHKRLGFSIPLSSEGFSKLSLDETLKYCGMLPEPFPHNALNGAKLEAEAFSRIAFGKNLFLEYDKFKIPGYLLKI